MIKKIIIAYLFCLNTFSMESPSLDYLSFLDTLVGRSNAHLNIEVQPTKIFVHGPTSEVLELKSALNQVLSSSEMLAKNLHYQLSETQEFPQASFELRSVAEGKEILRRLFKSLISDLSLTIDDLFREGEAKVVDGHLYSRNLPAYCKNNYQNHCDMLNKCFSDASSKQKKDAWDHGEDLKLMQESESDVENFISMISSAPQSCCMNVDLQAMFEQTQCLAYTNSQENTSVLVINKAALFERIKTLIGGDALLRLVRNEDEKTYALPILLPKKIETHRQSLHFFVIDTSDSVKPFIANLKQKLQNFIEYIAKEDAHAKVQLVSFGSKTELNGEKFDINSSELLAKISNLQAYGNTRLYGTMYDLFNYIQVNRLPEQFDVTITLFTDGLDNCSSINCEKMKSACSTLAKSINSITFGLGNVDRFLGTLAKETGGLYYPIEKIDELQRFIEQRKVFGQKQNFVNILVEIGDQVVKSAQVVQDASEINIAPMAIEVENMDTKIIIGNQEFKGFELDSVPPSGFVDHLQLLRTEIYTILSNTEKNKTQKINELAMLKIKTESYLESKHLSNAACSAALKTIDTYIDMLRQVAFSETNFQATINTDFGRY